MRAHQLKPKAAREKGKIFIWKGLTADGEDLQDEPAQPDLVAPVVC